MRGQGDAGVRDGRSWTGTGMVCWTRTGMVWRTGPGWSGGPDRDGLLDRTGMVWRTGPGWSGGAGPAPLGPPACGARPDGFPYLGRVDVVT